VVDAVATIEKGEEPSAVRWTSGILSDSASAVKQGVNKVTEALTPAPPAPAGDDPTQLSRKAKPTPELYVSVARFYEQSGNPAMADRTYQQALRLWPKNLATALNYARFKDRQGLAQEALQLYLSTAKDHPQEPAVFNDLGLFFARTGKSADGVRAFERAIQLQPNRPLYRNNLAALLVDMNQPDKAMSQLGAVYGEAEACYKLGYLLEKKGRSRDAAALFARAVQLNPKMTEARVWLQHLEGNQVPSARMAQRPMVPHGAGPETPGPASAPPILRSVSPDAPAGPRAGPQSVEGWKRPLLRAIPPPVAPLPSVGREQPSPEGAESTPPVPEAPLPDDAPDPPLPSDSGVRPLPHTGSEASPPVQALPPVE
jgi:tetratricopeptide (TPR) repeat protein